MRQDEFRFVLIDKKTRQEAILTFNDLYGYLECRTREEKGVDIGATEGIFVRGNCMYDASSSRDSYIPKFFRCKQISGNTSIKHMGCNKELLVKYVSNHLDIEYPELELSEFWFRVTDIEEGGSVVLTFDDLLAHEEGGMSNKPQGIFIENEDREGAKRKPETLAGRIFVNNNGYYCRGINPCLDIEYVGLPKKGKYGRGESAEERVVKVLYLLEQVWRENPNLQLGQLLCTLIPEMTTIDVEDEEIVNRIEKHLNQKVGD